jgi:hypothetical protein
MAQVSVERPPRLFGVMPFWFWNDDLTDAELLRQIADMDEHGVGGFVIHPRVGLPRSIGWMSPELLRFMKVAVDEAARRGLKVILYDEGMYPSGSSSGQVVQHDPTLACRCLAWRMHDASPLPEGHALVATVDSKSHGAIDFIDRKANSYIRGIHYIDEGPKEDEPPAGDILNPRTAELVLNLVHSKMHAALGEHFGKTIIGCFTDEPDPLGKCRESKNVRPYTTGLLDDAGALLGHDFSPHLPALFFDDEPDAPRHRDFWHRVVRARMDTSWYAPLSKWCEVHGVALCGHPADGDDIGTLKYFHIPGQDIVWRFIEPDQASVLEGPQSTQAKLTSSAMIHHGRSRNSNEFCGAYGNQTTFEEFKFLADWLLIRGVNLLIAHAFYYSVRGPRKEERPPDVGPNSRWWDKFKPFADACTRLSYLNSEMTHVCDVAIVCDPAHAPWKCAKPLYENQIDFNYVNWPTLSMAHIDANRLKVGPMTYRHVIIEGEVPDEVVNHLEPLQAAGHVTHFDETDRGYVTRIVNLVGRDVVIEPATTSIRVRHVIRDGRHFYMLHNERKDPVKCSITFATHGERFEIDTSTGNRVAIARNAPIAFGPYELKLIEIATTENRK